MFQFVREFIETVRSTDPSDAFSLKMGAAPDEYVGKYKMYLSSRIMI